MRNILTIVEREIRAYFASPIAYVVMTAFAFLAGLLFVLILDQGLKLGMQHAMQAAQFGQAQPLDLTGLIASRYLGSLSDILLFMVPMITMALFSEEKRRGTMELLLTVPITDFQVVAGKFLSAAAFFLILLGVSFVPMLVLFIYGTPAWGPIASAYLGLILYVMAIAALGMFISSLTENQIVAAVVTFVAVLFLYLMPWLASRLDTPSLKDVVTYLSVRDHLDDFSKGVLVSSHIIFYVSLTLVGFFLTYRSVDSLRWRG